MYDSSRYVFAKNKLFIDQWFCNYKLLLCFTVLYIYLYSCLLLWKLVTHVLWPIMQILILTTFNGVPYMCMDFSEMFFWYNYFIENFIKNTCCYCEIFQIFVLIQISSN